MQSESIKELAAALAKAQGEIKGAKKDADNTFFKSKYADLSSIVEAIREPFSKNGLSYIQRVEPSDKEEIRVETVLLHASGEWFGCGWLAVPVAKADAQGYGSALTYARRYSLSAAAGVAQEDDDGNAAAKAAPKGSHSPTDGAYAALSEKDKSTATDVAMTIVERFDEGKEIAAYEQYYKAGLSNEILLGVWELLRPHSKIRSALKAMHGDEKKKEA